MTELLEPRVTAPMRPDLPSGGDSSMLATVDSGQALREGREAAGVGPRAAAEALRLSDLQLQALENEQWDKLPGRPFVRAVLRAYARRLGVDATPLIERVGGYAEAAVLAPMPASASDGGSDAVTPLRHRLQSRLPLRAPWQGAADAVRPLRGRMRSISGGAHADLRRRVVASAGILALGVAVLGGTWMIASSGPADIGQIQAVPIPAADGADGAQVGLAEAGPGTKDAGTTPGPAAPHLPTPGTNGFSTAPVMIGATGALVAGAGSPAREPAPAPIPSATQIPSTPAIPSAPAMSGSSASVSPGSSSVAPVQSSSPPAPATLPPSATARPGQVAAAPGPSGSEAKTTYPIKMPDNEVVKLHFSRNAWVEMRHKNGEKLLFGEQPANRSITVRGVPPINVVIGNPKAVRVEFRGETLDLADRVNKKGIARFTLK